MSKIKELMTILKTDDLVDVIMLCYEVNSWYEGGLGMKQKVCKSLQKRQLDNLSAIGKVYGGGRPTIVYRLANVEVPAGGLHSLRQAKKLKISPRDLASFTTDKTFPEKFYRQFYADSGKRMDKRFAYVSVSIKVTDKNYIADTESCTKFLEDVAENWKTLKLDTTHMSKLAVTEPLKRVKSAFIKSQKEVIIYTAAKDMEVTVLDVFHSTLSEDKDIVNRMTRMFI